MKRYFYIPFGIVAWVQLSGIGYGQDRLIDPTRGFQPAHSYALEDIESIDKGTGALSLHIPITQLPPGPAGFTAGVTLSYSDKYWEAENVSASVVEYDLKQKDVGGGWYLSMTPQLEMQIVPILTLNDPCDNGLNNLMELNFINQDGSRNRFFRSSPDMLPQCAGTYWLSDVNTTTSTWFTTDGSYLRLVINAPTGSGSWPANSSWTLYRQDGSSVSYEPINKVTSLRDRNGNQIQISNGMQNNVSFELMTDPFGRSIRIDHYTTTPAHETITQTAYDGTTLTWTVNWNGFVSITSPASFKSQPTGNGQLTFNAGPALVSSLQLPNGLAYSFGYTSRYQELSDLTLPTGATVHYGYREDSNSNPVYYHHILGNTIATKDVTHDGVVDSWTFSYDIGVTGSYMHSTFTAPDGGATTHTFATVSYQYGSLPNAGQVTQIANADGSIVQREWQSNQPNELPTAAPILPNQWIHRELRTTADSSAAPSATSIEVFTIDKNGNTTSKEERGWVAYTASAPASSSATLLRKTSTKYLNGANDSSITGSDTNAYSTPTISATPRNLALASEVQDGSGTVVARSQFDYTESTPARTVGNLVNEYHWDSTKVSTIASGTALTTTNAIHKQYTYTANGNLSTESDPRGNQTTYTYLSISGCPGNPTTTTDFYRTKKSQGTAPTVVETWSFEYNCLTGLVTKITDPNQLITTIGYDNYRRPLTFTEGSLRKTTHTYNDSSRWIVTQNDVVAFNDQLNFSVLHFDQLGRIRLSRQLESAVADVAAAANDETLGAKTDTRYVYSYVSNASRNETWVSNPYRTSTSEASAPTRGWNITKRDTVGRICREETFAGASLPTVASGCASSTGATGITAHAFDATVNWTKETITDPAGAVRVLYNDVLGRLVTVIEDPTTTTVKYATYYQYDPLDNLKQVQQAGTCASSDPVLTPCTGGITRTFTYSSLKRLVSANNPESGQIQYSYDDAGNLVRRQQGTVVRCNGTRNTDNTCKSDGYDDLNRLMLQTYSDSTPPVTYAYDTANSSNLPGGCAASDGPVGRLASVSNSVSTSYYFYNMLGYAQCNRQFTSGANYDFRYTTSPQGVWTQIAYPSGRVVNTALNYRGLPQSVGSYATAVTYEAQGATRQLTLGNGLAELTTYNSRLQPVGIQVGSLLSLGIYYCFNQSQTCTNNNGNVQSQIITRGTQTWTQTYSYDTLNRLTTGGETIPGTGWSQTSHYDAMGNRWVTGTTFSAETPLTQNWYDPSSNRYAMDTTGWTYDGSGNISHVGGMSRDFTYDAENRQKTAAIGGTTTTYSYDGSGRRVSKIVGGSTTIFVYDAAGQLAAEYGTSTDTGTKYITADHLGSTRLETNSVGNVSKCYDYAPFGEELGNGVNGRGSCFGSSAYPMIPADVLSTKFTSKERDAETGLDYFGARYLSSAQGRFTSPDKPFADQYLRDPQSWNLYAYARNNPLRYIDDDGEGAKEFFYGMFNATSTNAVAGVGRAHSSDADVNLGQRVGDAISLVGGLIEMAGGGTISAGGAAACGTGVLCVAGAPAALSGAAIAVHGASEFGTAAANFMKATDDSPTSSGNDKPTFEPSSKHGPTDQGDVSRGPKDGQSALDNSVQVKGTSPRRVGVDAANGEIVVLDRTSQGKFHGHVRSWDQLTDQMRNSLIKNKLTDRRGNILPQEQQ